MYRILVHGGAIVDDQDYRQDLKKDYKKALKKSLQEGKNTLDKGGEAVDIAQKCVEVLEDCGLFDAGQLGAEYSSEGKKELDASIMNGKDLKAGSVTCVEKIKNPIKAARCVMDKTWHVMLSGRGAEDLAKQEDLKMVDPKDKAFFNEHHWKYYLKAKKDNKFKTGHSTVGAVVLDQKGNLAAATSTGGLNFKRPGRIGDTPIIGAGIYAKNEVCAVACTGYGEYFMRVCASYSIFAKIRYCHQSLEEATQSTLKEIEDLGGLGGIIALDHQGNVVRKKNCQGMFTGLLDENENIEITMIY